ncbi:major facilitator superfamily domain-containing protein 6 [Striga asiatica]|uniref:Major facilitator superfamily domain-containing protein 6 n=1 Tax=Striga asiatica TaxID=4170 RepID=A0A5A7PWK5_STRAF|nr:major facilitator superfamily domain-containing protein 6 [Striga asiatica]
MTDKPNNKLTWKQTLLAASQSRSSPKAGKHHCSPQPQTDPSSRRQPLPEWPPITIPTSAKYPSLQSPGPCTGKQRNQIRAHNQNNCTKQGPGESPSWILDLPCQRAGVIPVVQVPEKAIEVAPLAHSPVIHGKPSPGLDTGYGQNHDRDGQQGRNPGGGLFENREGAFEVVEEEDWVERVVHDPAEPLPEALLEAPEGAEGRRDPEDVAAVGREAGDELRRDQEAGCSRRRGRRGSRGGRGGGRRRI